MNAKTLFSTTVALATFSAITLFGASAAFAAEGSSHRPATSVTTGIRADVQAEAVRARAAGELTDGEYNVVIADMGPMLTRAQVKAETLEAIRIGAIDHGNHTHVPTQAQVDSIRLAGQRAVAMAVASR